MTAPTGATTLDYPVVLTEQPEGGFVVTFPDVPEAITQGEDQAEALMYAVDALDTAFSFYVDDHQPLPLPSQAKPGQLVVRPSSPGLRRRARPQK